MKAKLLFTAALFASLCANAQEDFTNGVFIVNEDWYGHNNSTINYFDYTKPEGEQWMYRVFQAVNPGKELGCTNQYGQIYGDRFFLIAKQEKDPGADITGGRITIADAKTLKLIAQSTLIDPSGNSCDGRAVIGLNYFKAYVSSSNGVWILDLTQNRTVLQIEGTGNDTGSLYSAQCGSMVRVNNYVFVAHQQKGLLVIDTESDRLVNIIDMTPVDNFAGTSGAGIGSVVLAKDGMLYVSVAEDTNGYGGALPYLMKVNPVTFETSVIEIPGDMYPPANSWYAWTPDGFCSAVHENALYWNGGENSWFSGTKIFKYDIDNNKVTKIIDLDEEGQGWQLYGCSMRPHPLTGELYLSLYKDFGNTTYNLRRTDHNGKLLGQYDMIKNYWFPSLPVFPDNYGPEIHDLAEQIVSPSETTTISLKGWATDMDNLDAGIVKRVAGDVDGAFTASIVNGDLVIKPYTSTVPEGKHSIRIEANSNGKYAYGNVDINFGSSGVDYIENPEFAGISINGKQITVNNHAGEICNIYNMSGSLVYSQSVEDDTVTFVPEINTGLYIVVVGKDRAKLVF